MRKVLVLVLSALIGGALAQDSDGWQHTLSPAFSEPFDFVQMPWPDGLAKAAGIEACWPDEQPPFFGADWRYWCYDLGVMNARSVHPEVQVGFMEGGVIRMMADIFLDPFNDGTGEQADALFRDEDGQIYYRYWLFQYGEHAFVGLATGPR